MSHVQLALLAWRYRKQLAVGAAVLALLLFWGLALVGSLFAVPMANEAQTQYYVQAVDELRRQK